MRTSRSSTCRRLPDRSDRKGSNLHHLGVFRKVLEQLGVRATQALVLPPPGKGAGGRARTDGHEAAGEKL